MDLGASAPTPPKPNRLVIPAKRGICSTPWRSIWLYNLLIISIVEMKKGMQDKGTDPTLRWDDKMMGWGGVGAEAPKSIDYSAIIIE